MIPIHGFPKMNIHQAEYVPKFINLGTVPVNGIATKEVVLKNIVTVPFEYEIVVTKGVKEITVSPLAGEVNALSSQTLRFKFCPESYGNFTSEFEFRLSEFDFKPVVVTVFGTCNVFDKVVNESIMKHVKKLKLVGNSEEFESLEKKSITSIPGVSEEVII